jgi:hypothetical protein
MTSKFTEEFARRAASYAAIKGDPVAIAVLKSHYKNNPYDFISDWGTTYDPRNAARDDRPTLMPFIPYEYQKDFIEWLHSCMKDQADGLVEKARDMGATVTCVAFSVWAWLFVPGASVGWGSRKEALVDRLGDPDSIFQKIRDFIKFLPSFLLPDGLNSREHLTFMKCINPENNNTITGEAGDNIGRGGRKLIYFKDESAHYERAELIEAALGDNTNVQIDISSVNGTGNLFYKKRHSGRVRVFVMDWRDHPDKDQEWYEKRRDTAEAQGIGHIFAQEVDRDYAAAVEGVFIPSKWVKAAINLKIPDTGQGVVGFDVADEEGVDTNAACVMKGPVVKSVTEWNGVDVSASTHRTATICNDNNINLCGYDSIGVGAGVRGPAKSHSGITFTPINVGSKKLPGTWRDTGRRNADMFVNLKAKLMWALREKFHRTWKHVNKIEQYEPHELISIPNDHELVNEISQPLIEYDEVGRIKVESKKKMKARGIKSPNRLDSLVLASGYNDAAPKRAAPRLRRL